MEIKEINDTSTTFSHAQTYIDTIQRETVP